MPETPDTSAVANSVRELLLMGAGDKTEMPALLAPGREPMLYGELVRFVESTVSRLNDAGIGRGHKVAIVLPNGPEMASAFVSIASGATTAPLNPNYRQAEFETYLSDLQADCLVTSAGAGSSAREAALSLKMPVLDLVVKKSSPAGAFVLEGDPGRQLRNRGFSEPDDIALLLHTSGTTSRPKQVPLSHSNLCASASNIKNTLELTGSDRCLNVMPLFHIHGLVAAILASLASGASIVCTPGFYAPDFFTWMRNSIPTWYTAVPTMHQAILERAASHRDTIQRSRLRFIRSSSASLPPSVLARLEETFCIPVLEAYGMTEASHQITCNPLPPAPHKPGSVGIQSSCGPEVSILDQSGNPLPDGSTGEVAIKGKNVTEGYVDNPTANGGAFSGNWFRTGDEGYIDDDGYLFLTGRLKELINRGGEKIAPREIDEVLLQHPEVAQALAFSVPHPTLGEIVAAAVVPVAGTKPEALALRQYVGVRLAAFKVPEQIVFLEEIPKGPTGKLQRIGLSERLGVQAVRAETTCTTDEVASTEVEIFLETVWRDLLKIESVSVNDHFLDLGGDSMLATLVIARIRDYFHISIDLPDFFGAPTIAEQAVVVEHKRNSISGILAEPVVASVADHVRQPDSGGISPTATIYREHGAKLPVFFLPGFTDLVRRLDRNRPFYSFPDLNPRGAWPTTGVTEVASQVVDEIRRLRPHGPYILGAFCGLSIVLAEVTRQLADSGESIPLMIFLDPDTISSGLEQNGRTGMRWNKAKHMSPVSFLKYASVGVLRYCWRTAQHLSNVIPGLFSSQRRLVNRDKTDWLMRREAWKIARRGYTMRRFAGRLVVVRSAEMVAHLTPKPNAFLRTRADDFEAFVVPARHRTMYCEPEVAFVADILNREMDAIDRKAVRNGHSQIQSHQSVEDQDLQPTG